MTLNDERLEREEKEFFLDFVEAKFEVERFRVVDCGVAAIPVAARFPMLLLIPLLFITTADPRLLFMNTFGIKPKFSSWSLKWGPPARGPSWE